MPSRFWKASGNALLPGSNFLVVGGAAWSPASLGSNLVADMTDLSMAKVYTDTGATTNVTADGQTVKAIKDSSGRVWTNSTGLVWHSGSGQPYLVMNGTNSFFASSVPFADASGQYGMWVSASLTASTNNFLLNAFTHGTIMNVNTGTGFVTAHAVPASGSTELTHDDGSGVVAASGQVYAIIQLGNGATGTVDGLVNDTSNGTTAWSGTPATSDSLQIGDGNGNFYGALIASGDRTADRASIQTYMAALHP